MVPSNQPIERTAKLPLIGIAVSRSAESMCLEQNDVAAEKHRGRRCLGIVLVLALTVYVSCRETFEERYPTLTEAEQAGAVRRGWIPHWTPPSAKDIAEIHSIDTSERLIAFSFGSYATDGLLKACSPLEKTHVILPRWAPVKWWPAELR